MENFPHIQQSYKHTAWEGCRTYLFSILDMLILIRYAFRINYFQQWENFRNNEVTESCQHH